VPHTVVKRATWKARDDVLETWRLRGRGFYAEGTCGWKGDVRASRDFARTEGRVHEARAHQYPRAEGET